MSGFTAPFAPLLFVFDCSCLLGDNTPTGESPPDSSESGTGGSFVIPLSTLLLTLEKGYSWNTFRLDMGLACPDRKLAEPDCAWSGAATIGTDLRAYATLLLARPPQRPACSAPRARPRSAQVPSMRSTGSLGKVSRATVRIFQKKILQWCSAMSQALADMAARAWSSATGEKCEGVACASVLACNCLCAAWRFVSLH